MAAGRLSAYIAIKHHVEDSKLNAACGVYLYLHSGIDQQPYLLRLEPHTVGARLEDIVVYERVDLIIVLVKQASEACLFRNSHMTNEEHWAVNRPDRSETVRTAITNNL